MTSSDSLELEIILFCFADIFDVGYIFFVTFLELFVLSAYDDQITVFVGNTRMTGPRGRNWSFINRNSREIRMILGYVILTFYRSYLELKQIIKENAFAFTLATENVNVVVQDAACMAISTLRHLTRLRTAYPAQEFKFIRIMSLRKPLETYGKKELIMLF